MVVGFANTNAISAYHFESRSWRGVHDTTLCNKVCQWHAAGWWISLGTPVSSTNKTVGHDITELLLLKVELKTHTQIYNILKIAELDCCQIIILSIYVPSTHA